MTGSNTRGKTIDSGPTAGAGPLAVVLAPDLDIIKQTRSIVGDTEKRQDAAADIAAQDPVIVMELFKTANTMTYSTGKPPATTVRSAITRMGAKPII